MNFEKLNSIYINMTIEDKKMLRRRKIIEEIFFEIISTPPKKENNEWKVFGEIRRYKNLNRNGIYEILSKDILDLEFVSDYLTLCEIQNNIAYKNNEYIALHYSVTLKERNQLEQYIQSRKQEKFLVKENKRYYIKNRF